MADGLESDDKGRLYGGDLEHNAIWRINAGPVRLV